MPPFAPSLTLNLAPQPPGRHRLTVGITLQNRSLQPESFPSPQAVLRLTPWGGHAAVATETGTLPTRLAPGQTVRIQAVIPLPGPGWYSLSLAGVGYRVGAQGVPIVQAAAAPVTVFAAEPPGSMRTGTVATGGSAMVQGIALTVVSLRFSSRATTVSYRIPGVPIPGGGTVSLQAGARIWPAFYSGIRNGSGPIVTHRGLLEGTTRFPPIPTSVDRVTVRLSDLTVAAPGGGVTVLPGPWRVTVPLPEEGRNR